MVSEDFKKALEVFQEARLEHLGARQRWLEASKAQDDAARNRDLAGKRVTEAAAKLLKLAAADNPDVVLAVTLTSKGGGA